MYGAIEAGGTKMVVALGDDNGQILKTARIPTETPSDTMPKILEFFKENLSLPHVFFMNIGYDPEDTGIL